jgi:hypothetical protein
MSRIPKAISKPKNWSVVTSEFSPSLGFGHAELQPASPLE